MPPALQHGRAEVVAVDPDRPDWLRMRRAGLGGSDIAAVAGLSPWRSNVEVWAEKTGQVEPEELDSEAVAWGHLLEGVVAEEAGRRLGLTFADQPPVLLRHPEHRHMLVTPDDLVVDGPEGPGVYEGKTTSQWLADDWARGATPDAAMVQAHWAAAILGRRWCRAVYIAALIGGQRLEVRAAPVNWALVDRLIEIGSDFWRLVEQQTLPERIDGSESARRTLTTLFSPPRPESTVELGPEAKATRDHLREVKAQIKALDQERDELANQLRAAIGDAEVATFGDEVVATWRGKPRTLRTDDSRSERRAKKAAKGATT